MLASNFASRTFAYRCLAQGLSRALSAFLSFMRDYLDKVIKADQCAQYVGNIGIAANDADHLIANLRATFKCIQEAGLELTMHKCHFGATESDFLGRTITPQCVKPHKQSVQNFLEKTKFPKSKKVLQRYLGFLNHVPRLSERLAPIYKMLKSDEEERSNQEKSCHRRTNCNKTNTVHKLDQTTTRSPNLRKTNQIIIEQSKDAVLQQLKAKILHEEYSEIVLQQDARYIHYANNLERLVVKEEILTRQYFEDTENVKNHQILLP